MFEVINMVARKLYSGQFEEFGPADPIDPLTHALKLLGILSIHVYDITTASTTSGQRGGLFGRNGMASLLNLGAERALLTFPPT